MLFLVFLSKQTRHTIDPIVRETIASENSPLAHIVLVSMEELGGGENEQIKAGDGRALPLVITHSN